MALRRSLAQRFLALYRGPAAGAAAERAKPAADRSLPRKIAKSLDDPGRGFLRRMLQNRSIFDCSLASPIVVRQQLSLPAGEKLVEKLRSIDRERIRLDVIHPPAPVPPDREQEGASETVPRISIEEARKVLKLSRTEAIKARLRATGKCSIPHAEFIQICCDGTGHREEGIALSKTLDESGAVLVLGEVVFLRPDQEKYRWV